MRGSRKRLLLGVAALAGGLAAVLAAVPLATGSGAKSCGATVKVTDHTQYVVNRYLKDAMAYVPGTVTVKSGCV